MDPTNNLNQNPNQAPNADATAGSTSTPSDMGNTPVNNIPEPVDLGALSSVNNSSAGSSNGATVLPGGGQNVVQQLNRNYTNPVVANPVNPVYRPNSNAQLAATDPIMKPEPAPAPDPVEEELKAPMKAAGPVPGSIGSAVSMPANGGDTATAPQSVPMGGSTAPSGNSNVSFNDPATENNPEQNASQAPQKKKNNKMLLIILIVVLFVVAGGLIVVLMTQMGGSSLFGGTTNNTGSNVSKNTGTGSNNSGSNSNSNSGSNSNNNTNTGNVVAEEDPGVFTCERALTSSELASYGADSGTLTVSTMFNDDGTLHKIDVEKSVISGTASGAKVVEENFYVLEDLMSSKGKLEIDTTNIDTMTAGQMITEFRALDYTCEVL